MTASATGKLKVIMVLLAISTGFTACSQSRNTVVKTYAYFVERTPGNIPDFAIGAPVEGNKDPRTETVRRTDTSIVIYVETKNEPVSWDTAWQGQQAYLISVVPINDIPFHAGFAKEKEIMLSPSKGNKLWQLQMTPMTVAGRPLLKISKEKLVLKGSYKGKRFSWKTGSLVNLVPLPSY